MHPQKQNIPSFFKKSDAWKPATGGECVHSQLGNLVDIEWHVKQGTMKISKSQNQNQATNYLRDDKNGVQIIKNVQFRHGSSCPLLDQNVKLNAQKFMKPCASVMLYNKNKNQILVTQRSFELRTFPGAWVLPGGHLDPGQAMIEGGVRQCQQQVGLPKDFKLTKFDHFMLWQSVFVEQAQVKGCALCLFFMIQCQQFDVKIDPRQVNQYKWKKIDDKADQTRYSLEKKDGYAQGHLKYLQLIRNAEVDI